MEILGEQKEVLGKEWAIRNIEKAKIRTPYTKSVIHNGGGELLACVIDQPRKPKIMSSNPGAERLFGQTVKI